MPLGFKNKEKKKLAAPKESSEDRDVKTFFKRASLVNMVPIREIPQDDLPPVDYPQDVNSLKRYTQKYDYLEDIRSEYEGSGDKVLIAALDLAHFNPNETSVRVRDNMVVIHGVKEKQESGSFSTSEFKKVYPIPYGVDPTKINSIFTKDGLLIIDGVKYKPVARVTASVSSGGESGTTGEGSGYTSQDSGQTGGEPDNQEIVLSSARTFQVITNPGKFKPDEIKLNVDGSQLVLSAKHEEGKNSGKFVTRSYVRRFSIPVDVDIDSMRARMSRDGSLCIQAERRGSSDSRL